jgi:hypothetical protein
VHQIWRPSLTCVVIAGSDPQSGFKGLAKSENRSAESKPLLFAGHDLQKSTGKARYFFVKTAEKPDCGSSPQ